MAEATQPAGPSNKAVWAGRIISGLIVLFMLFDATIKLLRLPAAVEGTVRLGYPPSVVLPLGVVALGCIVLYAIPRTAVLGAMLLTGYFGGATATQVRVQDIWFVMPIILGILVWAGLYLRDESLRQLIPLKREARG